MWAESGIITKQPQKRTSTTSTTTSTRTATHVDLSTASSRTGWGNVAQNSTSTTATKISPLFSSSSSSSDDFTEDTKFWLTSNQLVSPSQLQLHPDESNLYQIPADLHPTYRPLPILLRLCVWCMATLTSLCLSTKRTLQFLSLVASSTWTRHAFLTALQQNWKQLVSFLVKAILLAVLSQGILQDVLVPPSRISTQQLLSKYQSLPSTLSNYESVPVALSSQQSQSEAQNLGVHYLQYPSRRTSTTTKSSPSQLQFQALYVNHGFGASSLSWLPALPKLVDRLQTRVGLGHDAVGFGFTDRPGSGVSNSNEYYTPTGSAAIGLSLLQSQLLQQESSTNDDDEDDDEGDKQSSPPVLLMGHSMGSWATLHMALSLPPTTRKWVVLVAPALGMRPPKYPQLTKLTSKTPAVVQKVTMGLGRGVSLVYRYALRRLVGRPNFWRKGLEVAWGDPKKLSDSDVLRFQWPSIGAGWEDGLLRYVRAMATPSSLTCRELMERVLESSSNAVITVIVADKDKVVSSKRIQKFLAPYGDRIRIVEMKGLGHDPFEEDVDGFVNLVEQLLEEDKERILDSNNCLKN